MTKFALVDANPRERIKVEAILTAAGDRCVSFEGGGTFIRALHRESFDLVCLDRVDLVGRVRSGTQAPNLAIILITEDGDAEAMIAGFAAGADDVVVKPIYGRLLLARANAILRRTQARPARDSEAFGDVKIDWARGAITVGQEEVGLTTKEFNLAKLLFQNLDRPLSREFLMEEVWGLALNPMSRTLDTHICKLRSKLDLTSAHGLRLGPVYGRGYVLATLPNFANGDQPLLARA